MRSTLCDSGSAVRSNAKLSGCMVMGYLREGKREGERERERERQTDRQTEREREKQLRHGDKEQHNQKGKPQREAELEIRRRLNMLVLPPPWHWTLCVYRVGAKGSL